jgi:hypothetical protein
LKVADEATGSESRRIPVEETNAHENPRELIGAGAGALNRKSHQPGRASSFITVSRSAK